MQASGSLARRARPTLSLPRGPRVVIVGTFRRAVDVLRQDFEALVDAGCEMLSPTDVAFVTEVDGFVLAEAERGADPRDIERRHIEFLEGADFVWLHAPDGYVGSSAAMELGVAHAFGTPVLARECPSDVTLRHFAEPVVSIEEALKRAATSGPHAPTRPLDVLQSYYARAAEDRGYERESPQDTMLLLTEEIGELARAVRKRVGLTRAGGYGEENASEELADVQLYVLHLANVLGVELATAVAEKERRNAERVARTALAA